MSRPWYKLKPALLEQIKSETQSKYPNLNFYIENGLVFIRGSFPILHEGAVLDRYLIEVLFPNDYPESLPIVQEVGGRVPRTSDFHMSQAGEACLFLPDERWWVFPPGSTFLYFLDVPVHNFFLGQALVRMGDPWPFGQRAHGAGGIHEFYAELLGTNDLDIIIRYLDCLRKAELKGHYDCPCGSQKRLRHCHLDQLKDLKSKISSSVARQSYQKLTSKSNPTSSISNAKASLLRK